MVDNDATGACQIWTPGTCLAGFIKGITKHCYTQNIKALGLIVSEKKILFMFPSKSQLELSVAIGTRVLIRSGPNAAFPPTPIMFQIEFGCDRPTGCGDIYV